MNLPPTPSDCWNLVGPKPGPTVVVIGGTHGDEITGVEVIKRLLQAFHLEARPSGVYESTDIHGELFLVFGNPEAIRLGRRSASGIRDMNRCFLAADLERASKDDDIEDLVRARELAPILAKAQLVIDLHGTSNDSPPFVCFGKDSPEHRRLYRLFPVRYILTDPKNILAKDERLPTRGTTDSYAERFGSIAFCYETGKENDLGRAEGVTEDVIRLLQAFGSIAPDIAVGIARSFVPFPQEVYSLAHSIQAHSSHFSYAPGMDAGWQPVKAGQLVGTYADGTEERIPEDGMLVFPKSVAKIQVGKNLYYLAEKHSGESMPSS